MEEGDLVYVDYDIWIMPDNEDEEPILFDTTDEEKAKEKEIHNEDTSYGPAPFVIGEGEIVEGFYEALLESEVDEENSVEIPPEKGIGNRDPSKIELFSRRELDRKGIDPVVGKEVEIDNRRGTIIQATAGRIRVDFNHPLAGKTLKYDYKITEKPEDEEDIVNAIFEKNFRKSDIVVSKEEDTIDIVLPEECKYDQSWIVSKYRVVGDLRKFLDVKTINFIEQYVEEEEEELEEELDEESLEDLEEELDEEEEETLEEVEGESEEE
ncbi:MAG: FKBP-type peptidyl-prolyl cis-trans isomerase [Candidatus Saliniplasma sp.]